MGRIKLPEGQGFTLIPEGTYVFYIHDVTYDPDFGKIEVKMVTAKNQRFNQKYLLLDRNGEPKEGAMNAFAFFARTALQNWEVEEIDHTDLIGHFVRAEVTHTEVPSTREEGKTVTFANMGTISSADGFDEEPVPKVKEMLALPKDFVAVEDDELDALLSSLEV